MFLLFTLSIVNNAFLSLIFHWSLSSIRLWITVTVNSIIVLNMTRTQGLYLGHWYLFIQSQNQFDSHLSKLKKRYLGFCLIIGEMLHPACGQNTFSPPRYFLFSPKQKFHTFQIKVERGKVLYFLQEPCLSC